MNADSVKGGERGERRKYIEEKHNFFFSHSREKAESLSFSSSSFSGSLGTRNTSTIFGGKKWCNSSVPPPRKLSSTHVSHQPQKGLCISSCLCNSELHLNLFSTLMLNLQSPTGLTFPFPAQALAVCANSITPY